MTNDERSPNDQMTKGAAFFGHSDFGHSFVIRHSSFVIPCIRVYSCLPRRSEAEAGYSRAENSSQAEAAPSALNTFLQNANRS
jgi:hypothetical protein